MVLKYRQEISKLDKKLDFMGCRSASRSFGIDGDQPEGQATVLHFWGTECIEHLIDAVWIDALV